MNEEQKVMGQKALAKIMDYKSAFGSKPGERVLLDMMRAHFLLSTSYVKDDPYESARREGERNVVIRILEKLKTDEKRFEKLLEEANNDSQSTF